MVDSKDQITMVISEKLKEGILEASLRYGNEEEINSFVIPLTFSSTVSSPFAITEEVSFSDKCLFDNSLDLITTLNLFHQVHGIYMIF